MRWLQLNILSLLCGLVVTSAARAHEPKQGDVWATVGPYAYRTQTLVPATPGTPMVGAALVAEGDVDMNGGVEIAMIYVDKTYVRRQDEDRLAEHIKRMHIATGYRHWFTSWVSAGFALASAYSMGDPKVSRDERPSGWERETTAREITEYGFDLSLLFELWRDENVAIVADARYSRSLTRKSHEDADLTGLLLGFKYLVPKRGP